LNIAGEGLRMQLMGRRRGPDACDAAAQPFYARQGYTQAGVRKSRVGANDYDDLVFALAL